MPVEILELVVHATVNEQPAAVQSAATGTQNDSELQKTILIEQCVEQVLEILRHREER
jgi:Family of unknown function (DUF5908)